MIQPAGKPRSALLLLRTPFQAWLARQVLRQEAVDRYEMLYFTHDDAEEDRHYFQSLAEAATAAHYLHVPAARPDLLGHLRFWWRTRAWRRDRGYDLVLLSSIDALVPNAIAQQQPGATLVTFDDGTANLRQDSGYYVDRLKARGRWYRRMLGAWDPVATRARIARHYTLYRQFPNIVERDRLRFLEGWEGRREVREAAPVRCYFLGAPFEQVFSASRIAMLRDYLRELKIDCYVRHPRETKPLDIGAPWLEKAGRIAEEAILRDAGAHRIHLVGLLSTVMFNLAEVADRRTVIHFKGGDADGSPVELARKAGCEIHWLDASGRKDHRG